MIRFRLAILVVCSLATTSCGNTIPPINRVQPQVIEKSALSGEWFYQQTVIDHPHTIAWTIVGESSRMERLVWEIQEDLLIARRSYEWIADGEGPGASTTGEVGAPVAIYRVEGHFDIRREYNPVTGEEVNTLVENALDRPWYARRYMRVDWSRNLVSEAEFLLLARLYDGVEAESVAYYQEDPRHPDFPTFDHDEDGALEYFDITNKMFVQPTTIDFDDGWGPEPVCWLLYQTHTDCAPAEVTVRVSFLRTEPERGYQPWDYSGDRMERFGYFVSERPGFDDDYGVVEPERSFFINRHDIWEESYARDGDGGLVGCTEDADCGGDEESEAVCITWAQQLWSGEGEVHVTCEVTFAGSVRCSNGDYCPEPDPSGPPGGCQCAPGVVCDFDDVCVSDPPDGERRCVPKCS
jgi:hypothetical protein